MFCRIKKKKYEVLAFDIETHNDLESIAKKETSMWLGCLLHEESTIDSPNIFFYDMESFIEELHHLTLNKKRTKKGSRPVINYLIYIWNLSFEWSFILPVLLDKFNFVFHPSIDEADNQNNYFNSISTKSCSSVWEATLKFADSSGLIRFRDLSKIYQGKLSSVAKSFKLETQKGDIDYRLNRLHNHTVTKEEKEYCFKDVRIIIEIVQQIIKNNDKDVFQSLSASSYAMRKLMKCEYYARFNKPYKKFRRDYPKLALEESTFLRHSVAGGITYATPKYQFKEIDQPVLHIDMHSAHPTSMVENYFPYGKGEYGLGEPSDNRATRMSCCHILVSYTNVKLHSVIRLIGLNQVEDFELWVWDFEIDTMYKCYEDLEITYIDYYSYKFKKLPFRDFYYKTYELKKNSKKDDPFMYQLAKLLLNSSYGKLLEKPHTTYFENYIDEEGIIGSIIKEKDLSEKDEETVCNAKFTALQIGSCIPAYTRCRLVESALKFGYEKILYFDTDSIFVLFDKEVERIYDTEFNQNDELGGWGIEDDGLLQKAQFTAPKRYKYQKADGTTEIKAGGINFSSFMIERAKEKGIDLEQYAIAYEEVNITSSSWKVQRAFRVKGGTIIDFQDKEMKVDKKYKEIYDSNIKDDDIE